MGCMPSKNAQNGANVASAKSKISPDDLNLNEDIQASTKAHILDSIKKGDAILLEKTMHTYQVKPTEILGYPEQKKTILHYIAETNFVEGMVLALEYILQHQPQTAASAINIKDADGNTPAIICCLFDSVETLEVLMKSGQVNINAKNNKGYTAQIIAYESDSPCLNVITSAPVSNPKLSSRVAISGSQVIVSPGSSKRLLDVPNKMDLPLHSAPRKSSQLRSVDTLKKDSKLSPDTRLYNILQSMIGKTANFTDEEFPHDNQSVVIEEDNPDYLKAYGDLKWLRPAQFMKCDANSLSLFEGIDLNNVADSALAGCDLYSALAAMTEYPQRLVKVFTTKDINPHGAYSVKFLVSGIPVEIVLDDYFPCYNNSQPLFSKPLTNELWFSLIEKAFAKLYGSYSELSNIPISDVFQLLTGMPSAQFPIKNVKVDELWNLMLDYDKRNYIVCAGNTKAENPKSNRIFSVVRICENDQNRIVKLKNHFEDFTWNGTFSEGSEQWTKELKEDLGYYAGDKKYFYMDIEEFIKQFDFVSVCHYNENLTRTGLEVTSGPKEAVFFELEVEREMEVFISVHQKLPIFVDDSNYEISPVEILVVEGLDDNILRRVASGEKDAFTGKHTVYASDKIKTKLSEGKYIVRVKVRWTDGMNHDFVLNVFSPHSLGFTKVKARNHPDFLERVYLDAGSRSNDHYQLGSRCEFASSWCGSHLWLYGVNKGPKTWHLEINFNKIENLKLCKKYRVADNIVRLEIPPKGQGVAFAKRINSETVEMNWNFNQSWT